jgi:hypothetical protein
MINGITADLPLEDAIGVVLMLVRLGRALPATKWVDSMIAAEEEDAIDALF